MTGKSKSPKKQKLRNAEYYNMQDVFDKLYADSKAGKDFLGLTQLIKSDSNIRLAYRNIKKNHGSRTAGADGKTIVQLEKWDTEKLIKHIQKKLDWYEPCKVLRVEIPKDNGKARPLGIPTIMDRLIQQCVLQVLEPICEAKFHKRSFGFRPNRSCEHAIAAASFKMQRQFLHYVIDIDIKSFFDNVNHAKLLKQMWTMGIKDKKLLCIISAMLKAEIAGIGFPEKGTPQGGIISPLLSNIVLNELDWWISSQWETFETKRSYSETNRYVSMRKTNLKECYIIRYADDFKIFCSKRSDAVKLFEATKIWLKERLGLDISPEKSKIVNLKRHYSEFLGFKLKVHKKGKKLDNVDRYVVKSHLSNKAIGKIKKKVVNLIADIQSCESNENEEYKAILQFNSYIIGIHNYYQYATNVNIDLSKIAFSVRKNFKARLRDRLEKHGNLQGYIKERYSKSSEIRYLNGHPLVPLSAIQHRNPMNIKGSINNYTPEGRSEIHKTLERIDCGILNCLMQNPLDNHSIEFNDNLLALYCAQVGKCAVTNKVLGLDNIYCHHKTPVSKGGNDRYSNLVLLDEDVHKLIHEADKGKIICLLSPLNITEKLIEKINKLRIRACVSPISK